MSAVSESSLPVVIVGAGLAGLTVALHLAETQPVIVLAKREMHEAATAWAQGGIVGVLGSDDSIASHVKDTQEAGGGLVDEHTAEFIARHSAEAIAWLVERGVPFSSDPTRLTNNGHDTSYGMGLKLGVQSQLGEGVRFGASYQTKMSMSEFDDYAGLFANQGDFDIPATATVGMAFDAGDKLTVEFDVQWIAYGDVDSIANPMLPNLMMAPLGADGGAGFGWDDMTVFKLGAEYRASADATWYFGYSHTDQPIPSSEVLFNILAPGVVEDHFTVGYSRAHGSNGNRWTVSAMFAPSVEVRGGNPLDPAQTVELSMDQYEVEFSYHFKG